ncbi:MAG: hypothetical protein HeimC3_36150 [Candidatus Heimdallarchaeota archaeon LC_3]|nr:MAG: hypothetical protein HeimC3_36150 [Candidatus Heimdallarchaeota archaeon LC_3]
MEKKSIVGLIDFENVKSHYDPLLKGLSVCLTSCCRIKNSFKPNFEYYNILLTNYIKFNSTIDVEFDLLVDFILEGLIEDYNYVYWLINNRPNKVDDLSMNFYKEALIWFRDHSEEVSSKLKEILIKKS